MVENIDNSQTSQEPQKGDALRFILVAHGNQVIEARKVIPGSSIHQRRITALAELVADCPDALKILREIHLSGIKPA